MPVYGFGDFDELMKQLQDYMDAPDAQAKPWQTQIKPGDYVVRRGPGFWIYSEMLEDSERRPEGMARYRFTRSYSVACPDGELGDIHVSTTEPILSKEQFETAGDLGGP